MSHEVETMAYAHEVPWHGLGAKVTKDLSYKEMAIAAGLDWTVSLRPVHFKGSDGKKQIPMKDRFVLARDSDDAPLSVAGGRYKPTQNMEALRFFDRFVTAGKATMETAGSLRGGRMVWGLARLNTDFKLPGGDVVRGYILVASPHEVGKSLIAKTTPVRVVCANTMALAMQAGGKFEKRFPHVREFDADEASDTLDGARERMAQFADEAHALLKLKLSDADAVKILLNIYQVDKERDAAALKKLVATPGKWNPTVTSIWDCYQNAAGATPGNGWGLLNGATYRMNHKAGSNVDNRLASAWTGAEASRTSALMTQLLQKAA